MRVRALALILLGLSSAATSAGRDIRSARTAIAYVYELDDAVLPAEPVVLEGEPTRGHVAPVAHAAIERALADTIGVPPGAVHLRAASFSVSFRYDATLESAPLRLCLYQPTGESEVVHDRRLPAGGATILIPYEHRSYPLVIALRVENAHPEGIGDIQKRIDRELAEHAQRDRRFPRTLAHRVRECPEAGGSK